MPPQPFWGYLIRIDAFTVDFPKFAVSYDDRARGHWTAEQVDTYKKAGSEIASLLGASSGDS